MAHSLTDRFPRAKSTWLDALRPETHVAGTQQAVSFIPRRHRKHPLKSNLSGNVN
ncbi:MAG: hypothetical protein FD126_428 [Elusimicrobia bacterium]|nr:MAG: hypothetical protein FD126_428 [Elusimicrobiota bacterium]